MNTNRERIGVVGAGFQGNAIAFWFARKEFHTVIHDISESQLQRVQDELDLKRNDRLKKYITLSNSIMELQNCDLIIENIPEELSLKKKFFKKVEMITKNDALLASNSSTFIPSAISETLHSRDRFINIHFLGISWGQSKVELVPGKYTSDDTVQRSMDILLRANVKPVLTGECPGFVYNRIKLIEIANLFRAVEHGLVSLENALNYLLIPAKSIPLSSLDHLGLDITEASIRSLHKHYGKRYHRPRILTDKVHKNELGVKTGIGFFDYAGKRKRQTHADTNGPESEGALKKVYIHQLHSNNSNVITHLMRKNKKIYLGSDNHSYLEQVRNVNKKLYDKINSYCQIIGPDDKPDAVDAVLDFPPLDPIAAIQERIQYLQSQFGNSVPYIINLPIYRIEAVSRKSRFPDTVFGINAQRTYLINTELVRTGSADAAMYTKVKNFIREFAGTCTEVSDGEVRPLTFLLVSKMLEAIRTLEEGIGSVETIEDLLLHDPVFRDIDYFGLHNLQTVAMYLEPIFHEPFCRPKLLTDKVEAGHRGVISAKGFYTY